MIKINDSKMPEQDSKLIKQTAGEWERYHYFDDTDKKCKQGMRKANSGTKTSFRPNKISKVPQQQSRPDNFNATNAPYL